MKVLLFPFLVILLIISVFIGVPLKWVYSCNLYSFRAIANAALWSVGNKDRLALNLVKPFYWKEKQ